MREREEDNKQKPSGERKEDTQMKWSTKVARAQERTVKELLQYDASSTSYLFHQEGLMTKPQKTALVHDLETKITKVTVSYTLLVSLM